MFTPVGFAVLTLAASACGGSSTSSPSSSSSGVPAQSFKAAPTFSSTGYALGDTNTNPDQSYECAASGQSDGGTTIAYATVAGNDNAEATQACAAMESSGAWSAVQSISGGSYETTPVCHITTADSATTIRIYTAKPDGDDSTTTQLCAAMAQGFGAK
ncbi:MAG: hypothetical protein JOZ75_12285 [Candidatus Dormibacteraeota bacterium]|nr:hypothetical protein [Candidatus Dormibacteraeota bacterium]